MSQGDFLDSARGFGGDVFKTGGFASDHRAEANDGIVASGFAQKIRYLGQFECSGARKHLHILPSYAVPVQTPFGAI